MEGPGGMDRPYKAKETSDPVYMFRKRSAGNWRAGVRRSCPGSCAGTDPVPARKSTPVLLVVTYGSRAYEDALLELKTMMAARGFVPVGGAAVVTEHSIIKKIAASPDKEDQKMILGFVKKLKKRLEELQAISQVGSECSGKQELP